MDEKNKEIVVLDDRTHLTTRPSVYVGSVKPTEERIPIIRENRLLIEQKNISIGMYKLFDEVFSNSLDEAKRMKGKMNKIEISINSVNNSITIKDRGNGFYKGTSINKTTKKTNIETAISFFRAGSNFSNDNIEESLVGTNGLGISCVSGLSDYFEIITINDTHHYTQEWNDFKTKGPLIRPKSTRDIKGTQIRFIPLPNIFGHSKWDREILTTTLILKYNLIKRDPILNKLDIEFFWDGEKIDLQPNFLPDDAFKIDTEIGQISIWEKYEGSGSISFVNSAICTGIHQKIINDFINEKLGDTLGHHFYDSLIVLNLPPKYVNFGDQNKTKYVTPREDVESLLHAKFGAKLMGFFKTDLFDRILKKVEERTNEGYIKKLRAEKKKVNLKHSHKYFPAQRAIAENLFIVEGQCIDGGERINIWREGKLMNIQLKDVNINDEVITHNNRFRRITNKQKKLKSCIKIKLKNGTELNQPPNHRYYIFDKIANKFYFKKVSDLDLNTDCLVKSHLGNFMGTLEVIDKVLSGNIEYPNIIELEDGTRFQYSNSHKYCIFDVNKSEFRMVQSFDIIKGDLICVFHELFESKDITQNA